MNIEINRINTEAENNPAEFVRNTNQAYVYQLERIAENIVKNKEQKPVILLSGPSGSGKTTTALMLADMLTEKGCKTHTLSMDNYFCPLTEEERKLSVLGKIDLESPLRVDSELLSRQIKDIADCVSVDIPKYNFATSKREASEMTLKREKGELVIFEGIHALNPDVITTPESEVCKLYVSVRTRITCNNIVLHPSKVRLLRRMIRDSLFRQRSVRETMNMFQSVENGENKYIMPYKHRSDYDIDTFMAYELNVYKNDLLWQLREMTDIPELEDVTKVLENSYSINRSDITSDSLICEFVGNGKYNY